MNIKETIEAFNTLKNAPEQGAPLREKIEAVQKRIEPKMDEMNKNLDKLNEDTAEIKVQTDKIQKALKRFQADK